jgi:biopolymer transport protein ExbB
MSFDLAHIWASMGLLGKGIAGALILMAIASIAVCVERIWGLSRSAKASRAFAHKAAEAIDDWRVEELLDLSDKHKTSALARLFGSIVERYLRAFAKPEGGLDPVELARHEAERRRDAIGSELRRGLNVLASVGSVAPFVGLLGTVVGIIGAFQGIATTGSGGLAAVSAGIAESLVETALGLLVAIPAVLMFNYLTARINAVEAALARASGELLDEMEYRHGRKSADARSKKAA